MKPMRGNVKPGRPMPAASTPAPAGPLMSSLMPGATAMPGSAGARLGGPAGPVGNAVSAINARGAANPGMVAPAGAVGLGSMGTPPAGPVNMGGMGARLGSMSMKKGGSVKSASARADGCAIRGKTKA